MLAIIKTSNLKCFLKNYTSFIYLFIYIFIYLGKILKMWEIWEYSIKIWELWEIWEYSIKIWELWEIWKWWAPLNMDLLAWIPNYKNFWDFETASIQPFLIGNT